MKSKARIIVLTTVCTTLFWVAAVAAVFWYGASGAPSARVTFPRPGELEVFSGAYRVEVVASNAASASLLFSHTARAPERVSFSLERLDTRTAQR
jgi:flagellar basal body-associated protein FliL